MAMRCFGRAFDLAAVLAAPVRPFDLMALRALGLAALRKPVHFFFTAGCAAGRDVAFCLAISEPSRFFIDRERLAQKKKNAGLQTARRAASVPCTNQILQGGKRPVRRSSKSEGGSVPTCPAPEQVKVGTARARLCPPYGLCI